MSQSLWVRDRFLMVQGRERKREKRSQSLWVRDRFLMQLLDFYDEANKSQSLWVRDRFLIPYLNPHQPAVCRNPFGAGTGF